MKTLDDFIFELNKFYYEHSVSWCKEEKNTFRGRILEEVVRRIVRTQGYKVPKHKTRSKIIDTRAYKGNIKDKDLRFVGECSNNRYGLLLVQSNIQSLDEHFSRYPEQTKYAFISFEHHLKKHGMEMLRIHKPTIIEFGFQLVPEGEYNGHSLTRPLSVDTYNKMERIISEVISRCPP